MKVLFLHQTFPSANEEGSGRAYDFAKHLVQQGHDVTIIAGNFSYLAGNSTAKGRARFIVVEDNPEGFLVLRPWSYNGYHKGYSGRVLTFITYMITCFITTLSAGRFDLIVGASPPISVGAVGAVAAFLKRTPYVFEVRDLWSEVAIQLGFISNSLLIAMIRWIERRIYRFASRVIINSPGFAPHLETQRIRRDRVKLVPNGVDLQIFRPGLGGDEIKERYGLKGKVVGVYAGSLGMANDINTILRAAELTRDEGISFVLVGDGKERPQLERECSQRRIDNVIFAGPQRKQDIPLFLGAADAGVVTLLNIPLFKTVYPNKVFDAMACEKPVILLVDGVARQLVEDAKAGLFVPPANPEKLAQAMIYLRDNPVDAAAMGRRGRPFLEAKFERWKCAELLEEVLVDVFRETGPLSVSTC